MCIFLTRPQSVEGGRIAVWAPRRDERPIWHYVLTMSADPGRVRVVKLERR